jgi:TonB family protein
LLPEIATSPRTIGPVTVGLRHGLLLLPPGFLDNLTPHDRDAVFTHELAHMARHDFAKNLLYGLASLPVAWHPLVWCTRARIAESRELVCDTIAAEAGPGRKQYAQSLLRLAAMLSGHPSVAGLHAIGILSLNPDANTLERRIMTLTHKRTPMSAARRTMVAAACSAIILATCGSALALRTDVAAFDGTAGSPTRIHVKGAVMAGQKIAGENPTYPKQAREKKIQGTVLLELTIGKDGAPQDLHVTESPDKELADSAMKAVRTWRWRPYLLKGDPVEVETTVRVTYSLEG